MKKRLLDLFCCEGGAGAGYARAGFEVFGVDIGSKRKNGEGYTLGPLRHYPFDYHHGDALAYVAEHAHEYDAIHASPPCQGYTRGNAGRVTSWPKLIPDVRRLLVASGKPYVIENVKDAGPHMIDPQGLCGCMFGPRGMTTVDTDGVDIYLQRLRLFETNWGMVPPRDHDHTLHEWVAGAYGGARRDKYEAKFVRKGGYVPKDKSVVAALLGVEHDMTWNGLFECIPPVYTEYIGSEMLRYIEESEEGAA